MKRHPKVVLLMGRDETYSRGIILGFSTIARESGWDWHVIDPREESAEPMLRHINPAAFAIGPVDLNLVPEPLLRGKILVGANFDLSGAGYAAPSVLVNDRTVGREAARHLVSKGIKFFSAFGLSYAWSQARAEAFREYVQSAGLEYVDLLPMTAKWDHAKTEACRLLGDQSHNPIRERLLALPKPVGVFACCDVWGQAISAICRSLGVRIPEEVALVGVDNDKLRCRLATPRMSSVIVPWQRMGAEVARLLGHMLRGSKSPAEPIRIAPVSVATRRSSDLIAVDDPEVASALTFIHNNATQPIRVADILRHVPTHQHRLERSFRRIVGRRMLEEIRRVHVEAAKRLLAMTPLQMPQVAERSGFASAKKLSEAFRELTSVSPTEYRRRFQVAAVARVHK